jgi:dihydroflavonol-4-reductase
MIAVTGANGLLGSYIVRKLVQDKLDFIALKRSGSDLSLLSDIAPKIKWVDADVTNAVALEDAFKGVTHVIHAAAIVSFNPSLRKKLHDVNVLGTRNVVNACLSERVQKLVHISSVAALGRLPGETEVDENHKWVDNPLNTKYAETKYLAELEVYRGQEEGLNTVILNPSVILAAADWTKSSAKLFKYVWDEKKFYVEKEINVVDVRDVAAAAVQFLRVDAPGQRFILNASTIKLETFFSSVAKRFKKKPPQIRVNRTVLKWISRFESIRAWLTQSEPLITRETARMAGTAFTYSNKKIRNQLNFQFQSIDETLNWCCDYYITHSDAKK